MPTNFNVVASGLVCDDISPNISNFIILDQYGVVQTGNLDGGSYEVFADISSLLGYDNYTISQTPGSLFVNPVVGCNRRERSGITGGLGEPNQEETQRCRSDR